MLVEIIEHNGLHLATLIHASRANDKGPKFYTPESSQFQVGIHNKSKGERTKPHYYVRNPTTIEKPVQEIFYVESGRIRIILYGRDNRKVAAKKELQKGDMLIIMGTAHAVDFLEDTRLIEIKQGPFQQDDKVSIEE